MANFKIISTTTVSELKEQFLKEFGGVLREFTLDGGNLIPKNTTKAKMQEMLDR